MKCIYVKFLLRKYLRSLTWKWSNKRSFSSQNTKRLKKYNNYKKKLRYIQHSFASDIIIQIPRTCTAVSTRTQHVMDSVSVENEGRVWYVVFPCSLREGQPFLQNGEYSFGHGFRAPGLERSALAESQVVNEALIRVPALLPHRLQLVLVAICWKWKVLCYNSWNCSVFHL